MDDSIDCRISQTQCSDNEVEEDGEELIESDTVDGVVGNDLDKEMEMKYVDATLHPDPLENDEPISNDVDSSPNASMGEIDLHISQTQMEVNVPKIVEVGEGAVLQEAEVSVSSPVKYEFEEIDLHISQTQLVTSSTGIMVSSNEAAVPAESSVVLNECPVIVKDGDMNVASLEANAAHDNNKEASTSPFIEDNEIRDGIDLPSSQSHTYTLSLEKKQPLQDNIEKPNENEPILFSSAATFLITDNSNSSKNDQNDLVHEGQGLTETISKLDQDINLCSSPTQLDITPTPESWKRHVGLHIEKGGMDQSGLGVCKQLLQEPIQGKDNDANKELLSSDDSVGEEIDLHISQTQGFIDASPTQLSQTNASVDMQLPKAQIKEMNLMETSEEFDIFQEERPFLSLFNKTGDETIISEDIQASFAPVPTIDRAAETMAESGSWLDARTHSASAVGAVYVDKDALTTTDGEPSLLRKSNEDEEVNRTVIVENVNVQKQNFPLEEKKTPLPTSGTSTNVLIVDVESLESKIKEGKDLAAVKAEVEKKLAEMKRLQALLLELNPENATLADNTNQVDTKTNESNDSDKFSSARKRFSTFASPSVSSVPAVEPTEVAHATVMSTPHKFRRKMISSFHGGGKFSAPSLNLLKDQDWTNDDEDISFTTTRPTLSAAKPAPVLLTSALSHSSAAVSAVKIYDESAGSRTKLAEALFSGHLNSSKKKPPLPTVASSSKPIENSRLKSINEEYEDILEDTQDDTSAVSRLKSFQRLRKNELADTPPSTGSTRHEVNIPVTEIASSTLLGPKTTTTNNTGIQEIEKATNLLVPVAFLTEPVPKVWSDVWSMLESVGWHWTKGKGLIDFFYLKPSVPKAQKPFSLGIDYFGSADDVLNFVTQEICRLREEYSIVPQLSSVKSKNTTIENDPVKSVPLPPKKREESLFDLPTVPSKKGKTAMIETEKSIAFEREIGRKRKVEELEESNPVMESVYPKSTESEEVESEEVEWNPMLQVDKGQRSNQVSEPKEQRLDIRRAPWPAIWKILRRLGWQWDFGPGHVNYYYRPGFSYRKDKEATLGFDKFQSEDAVRRFIKREMRNASESSSEWATVFCLPERTPSTLENSQLADAYLTDPNWTLTSHRPKRDPSGFASLTAAISTASSEVSTSSTVSRNMVPQSNGHGSSNSASKRLAVALTDSLLNPKPNATNANASASFMPAKRAKLEAFVPSTVSSSLVESVYPTSQSPVLPKPTEATLVRSDSELQNIATQPQEAYYPTTDHLVSGPTGGDGGLRRKQSIPSLLTLSPSKQLSQQTSPTRSVTSTTGNHRKRGRSDILRSDKFAKDTLLKDDEDKDREEEALLLPATSASRNAAAPSLLAHVVTARSSPRKSISLQGSSSKIATAPLGSSSAGNISGQKRSHQHVSESLVSSSAASQQHNARAAVSTLLNGYEILLSGFVDEVRDILVAMIERNGGKLLSKVPVEMFQPAWADGSDDDDADDHSSHKESSPLRKGKQQQNTRYSKKQQAHLFQRHILLLSKPSEFRKPKFIQALIAGIPLIHYQWLLDSIEAAQVLSLASFFIPAGYSALHAHYVISPKYLPWLRTNSTHYQHNQSVLRYNELLTSMSSCQKRRFSIFDSTNGLQNPGSAGSSVDEDGTVRIMNLTGLKAWDEILMSMGMQVIPADHVTCERLRVLLETYFSGRGASNSNINSRMEIDADYLLFDPVTFVRSAIHYGAQGQLQSRGTSTHAASATSAGSPTPTREQIQLLKLCATMQQHAQRHDPYHHNQQQRRSALPLWAVSIDWLAHCIFLHERLSPAKLDLFQLVPDYHREILVFKGDLSSGDNSKAPSNDKAAAKPAERYCKYDLVYYDPDAISGTGSSNGKGFHGRDRKKKRWSVGRIVSIHRRPTAYGSGVHDGGVLLRTALNQQSGVSASTINDEGQYMMRIMRMEVFDAAIHGDDVENEDEDVSQQLRRTNESNESFKLLEPTIPRQEVFIQPHQLRGKVVLLTRHHAMKSSPSSFAVASHQAPSNRFIHPMQYISLPAQNRRRQVWTKILTQHLQHMQRKTAGTTSSSSSVSSSSASKKRDPDQRLTNSSSALLKLLDNQEEEEWLEDVLVTTPLYEDELPVVPWLDSQEQYPDQFVDDDIEDDAEDEEDAQLPTQSKRPRYASQDM